MAAGEVVVAVELTSHPFALGLWWRPEAGDDHAIFAALRDAAQRRAAVSPARAGFAAAARKSALR